MTSFSALEPWLVVLAIAVVGTAAGIVVVRRVTPGILSAATTTNGASRGEVATVRDGPGTVVVADGDFDGPVAATDEHGTEKTEPAASEWENAGSAVSRTRHVAPIAPETVDTRTDGHLEGKSTETTPSGAFDTSTDVDRAAREVGSDTGPDRDEQRPVGRTSEGVAGGAVPDGGAEETVGLETSRPRAGDELLGYVALGLGFLCLVGLVLLEGVYAEQLTVIGILLYGLVLLVFYEQLGSATSTPAPVPVVERSDAEGSSDESGRAEDTATDPSRTDVPAGSEAADRAGDGAPPGRHEVPADERPAKEHRPAAPGFPSWNENGTRMPAWGWSRAERTGAPGGDVLVRDRLDGDESTPDDRRDGDAETSDIDDADELHDADPDGVSTLSEFACEYCGRDDFESASQRNGHLRWCDEYDPNASATDDGEEATGSTVGSDGTAETDDRATVGSSADVNTSGTEPAGEVDATAETAGDDEGSDDETAVDETGDIRILDAGTAVERDATEREAAEETVETDTEQPSEVDLATVAGAASTVNGGGTERGDPVATAPNTPPEGGRSPTGSAASSAHTSDEQSVAVPASTVSTARRHLRAGRLDEAVYSAYRSVKEEVCSHNDLPTHRTHREFSAACREVFGDDDSVEALDRLVAIYERLYYANDADTDRTEIETLLDRLVDPESSRS